ncbi:MAG: hypothetical protein QOD11_1881 [Bradyrhizobium sp.]|jgi:hypothetical protein|nr:hypothetical protein [Bradyrhizobium sp.]
MLHALASKTRKLACLLERPGGDLHAAVSALPPEDRLNSEKVNQAVRDARNPNAKYRWYYENGDQLEVFRSEAEGEAWLKENDPEGVLWKGRVGERIPAGTADQHGVPVAADETDTTARQ